MTASTKFGILLISALASGHVLAAPSFKWELVAPVLPPGVIQLDMNSLGDFTGYRQGGYESADAVIGHGGTVIDLGLGRGAQGRYINESGMVAGVKTTYNIPAEPYRSQVFVYDGATVHDIVPNAALWSSPIGLNASGQVIGWTTTSEWGTDLRGFFYDGQDYHQIPLLADLPNPYDGIALDLNNQGTVVGFSSFDEGIKWRAFSYSQGVLTSLGTLGGENSLAQGINDSGLIVGSASTAQGNRHAFLHDGTQMIDITPDGNIGWAEAYAINAAGQVGGAWEYQGQTQPFYYDGTQTYNLNDLVLSLGAFQLIDGARFDASGRLIATAVASPGGPRFQVALSPVPEPTAWGLGLAGLMTVLVGGRRLKTSRNRPA